MCQSFQCSCMVRCTTNIRLTWLSKASMIVMGNQCLWLPAEGEVIQASACVHASMSVVAVGSAIELFDLGEQIQWVCWFYCMRWNESVFFTQFSMIIVEACEGSPELCTTPLTFTSTHHSTGRMLAWATHASQHSQDSILRSRDHHWWHTCHFHMYTPWYMWKRFACHH